MTSSSSRSPRSVLISETDVQRSLPNVQRSRRTVHGTADVTRERASAQRKFAVTLANKQDVLFRGQAPLWKVVAQRIRWVVRCVDPWGLALLDRLGLAGRRGCRSFDVCRRDEAGISARLLVRLGGADQRTINEVWLGRAYDQRLDAWKSGNLDVILDVGANAGYFSVLAGRLASGAVIVSIEPDPDNQKVLQANLGLNDVAATIVRAAVVAASTDGQRVTLHRAADPRLHTLKPVTGGSSRGLTGEIVEVEAVALAELCERHAPAPARIGLKVDIEGDEWPVLQSVPDEVWARVVVAAVESDDPMPADLGARLGRLGFDVAVDAGVLYSMSRRTDVT